MKSIAMIFLYLLKVCSGHETLNTTLLDESQSCNSNEYVQSLQTTLAKQHGTIVMLNDMLKMNNILKNKCTDMWVRMQKDNVKLMDDNQNLMSQNSLLMKNV
jgi:hypothetical protein